jgi:hypothetical protein
VLRLELLAGHSELTGKPGAGRQIRPGGSQVAAQEVHGSAVQQEGRPVVGVEVGEQGDCLVALDERVVESATAQGDDAVELVDQRSQVPSVVPCRPVRG